MDGGGENSAQFLLSQRAEQYAVARDRLARFSQDGRLLSAALVTPGLGAFFFAFLLLITSAPLGRILLALSVLFVGAYVGPGVCILATALTENMANRRREILSALDRDPEAAPSSPTAATLENILARNPPPLLGAMFRRI